MLLNRHAKCTRDVIRIVTLPRIHRLLFLILFGHCRRLLISSLLLFTLMEYLGRYKVKYIESFTLELDSVSENLIPAVTGPAHFLIKQF